LAGRDLFRAQERLIAAILRAPSLASAVRVAGLDPQHIHPGFRYVFEFAISGDRDQIRRAVQSGSAEVARLYRLGVEMGLGQVVHLGKRIRESVERERARPTFDTGDQLACAPPAWQKPVNAVSAEERSEDAVTAPAIAKSSTAGAPKPSGIGRKAAVVAFLRDLAPGPVAAGEIERLAIAAGLLGEGKSVGKCKVFRTVRKSLGITTSQRPGEQAGGWLWKWPDMAPA
jgi:hypothetical protein